MNFVCFDLKKIYKNKLNLTVIFLIIMSVFLLYLSFYLNKFGTDFDAISLEKNSLINTEKFLEIFNKDIKNMDKTTQDYQIIKDNISIATKRINFLENLIKSYENKDWKDFYLHKKELLEMDLNNLKKNSGLDEDSLNYLKLNFDYYDYMSKKNLEHDDLYSPLNGISFSVKSIETLIPFLMIFILSFFYTGLFTSENISNLDLRLLLPISRKKLFFYKIGTSFFIGLILIIFTLFFSFVLASIANYRGSFDFPIIIYRDGKMILESFLNYRYETMVLGILVLLFSINVIYFISNIFKKSIVSLFTSIIILFGGYFVVHLNIPLHSISHFSPFTYITFIKVITGEMAQYYLNSSVNYMSGVKILFLFSAILFLSNMILFNREGEDV